jgi:hypothetical protein
VLQVEYCKDESGASVMVRSSTGWLAFYVASLVVLGPIVLIVLLISGGQATALGYFFVGLAALNMVRQMNVYTEFRKDAIRHRGVFRYYHIPMTAITHLWFEATGATLFLVFRDGSAARFSVIDRAVGRDLAARREQVAAFLTAMLGAPYTEIATPNRPTGIALARKDPPLRRFSRFARLLPSEWAVIVATVAASSTALIVYP